MISNPVPYGDDLSLNINEYESSISLELAVSSAYHFNIEEKDAMKPAFNECYK